jgi:putative DNA primase/helicase
LNWAIEGWRQLRERGYFVQPGAGLEVVEELEDLGSPIGAFIRDCCLIGAGQTARTDNLFLAWQNWCKEQGRERPGDKITFGRNLRAAVPGVRVARSRVPGEERRDRSYDGIGLQDWLTPLF